MRAKLDATMNAMNTLYLRALTTESYDQMIGEGNDEGNAVVQHAIDALLDQTKSLERAVADSRPQVDQVRRLRQPGQSEQGGGRGQGFERRIVVGGGRGRECCELRKPAAND